MSTGFTLFFEIFLRWRKTGTQAVQTAQRSEQAMAWTLIEAAAAFTIWIGDRNSGVWSVVGAVRALPAGCAGAPHPRPRDQAGPRPALAQRRGSADPVVAQPQRSGPARHGALGGKRAVDLCAVAKEREMDRAVVVHHPELEGLFGRTAGDRVRATVAS